MVQVEVLQAALNEIIQSYQLSCTVCGLSGVRRDAVVRTMLSGGLDRLACKDHALYSATINGESQIVGLEPVEQPKAVVIARGALSESTVGSRK